jgi:hypothetical protein
MKYFLSLIVFFITFSLQAQKFEGGLFGGLSTSQVDGDANGGYHRAGINTGVFVALPFSTKWAGQFEIKYIQKGSYKGQNPDAGDYDTYGIKLRYIEMPLIAKYLYKPKISFESGLAIGYLAASKEEFNGDPIPGARPFRKYEFSWLIGGNYQLFKKIAFNVRYSYSILPIRKHAGDAVFQNNRGQYNNVLSFSFYFKLGAPNE